MPTLLLALQILCVGDSLTQGVPEVGLNTYCDQSAHTTTNLGRTGWTIGDWLVAFDDEAVPALANQDAISILIGTNDVLQGRSSSSMFGDLESLVGMFFDNDVSDIVLSIPPHIQGDVESLFFSTSEANSRFDAYAFAIEGLWNNDARIHPGVDWRTLPLPYSTELGEPNVWLDTVHPWVTGHTIATPYMDAAFQTVPEPGAGLSVALGFVWLGFRQRNERARGGTQ